MLRGEIFSWSPVARGSDGAPRAVRSRLWHREEVPEAGRGAPCRWRVPSEDPPDRRAGPRRVPGGSALVPFVRRLKDAGYRVQENPVHGLSRRRGDEEAHRGGEPSDARRSTRTCAQTTPLLTRNSSCFLPCFAPKLYIVRRNKARSERHAGGRVRSAGDGESGKSRRELVDCVRRGPRRGGCIRHRVKPRKHDELRSARGV